MEWIAPSSAGTEQFDTQPKPKTSLTRRIEFIALAFGIMWSIFYPLITAFPPVDLQIFIDAATGTDLNDFYYTPWSLPFFWIFSLFPIRIAAIIANLISLAGFSYALRVFNGNHILMYVSYPFFMLTYYGQVDGVYAFGLALMYVALRKDNTVLASIGWMIAIVKIYVGLPLGLGLCLYFSKSWRSRAKIVALMGIYGLASIFIWQGWIPNLLERSSTNPPNFAFSMDLWQITGPAILVLWIPIALSRRRDFIWWTATWLLTVPYLYVWTLSFFIMLPVGLIIWGVQISFATGFVVSTFLQIIPLIIYLQRWWLSWRTDWLSTLIRAMRT